MWFKLLILLFVSTSGRALKIQNREELKSGKASCNTPTSSSGMILNKRDKNVIEVACKFGYTLVGRKNWVCNNGTWKKDTTCELEDCGTINAKIKLVAGGTPAEKGELPWNAMVYDIDKQEHSCGGSLVTKNGVISAAHCFVKDPTSYEVAVGKIYRKWHDERDKETQISCVSHIYMPETYETKTFLADIAVLKLTTKFEYGPTVAPICLNFNKELISSQLAEGNKGLVAGWGLVERHTNKHPIVLQKAQLPNIDRKHCERRENKGKLSAYSILACDKICAGYVNKDISVCKGDSGAGLAFTHTENDVERYYLQGVVSNAQSTGQACSTNKAATFTKLAVYKDFIDNLLTQFKN